MALFILFSVIAVFTSTCTAVAPFYVPEWLANPKRFQTIWTRIFLSVGLIYGPTLLLLLSMASSQVEWKGEAVLGWFGCAETGSASLVTLPLWLACCAGLQVGLIKPRWLLESRIAFLMIATLAGISIWYGVAAIVLEHPVAIIPSAWLVMVFVLLLFTIWHRRRQRGQVVWFIPLWISGIVGTIWAKLIFAHSVYEALPDNPPACCFIVTASARGHRWFVGSRVLEGSGQVVNDQLLRMWELERQLMQRHPVFHAALRRVYNVVGPVVARHIRHPLAADAMYLMLKPIEFVGAVWVRLCDTCDRIRNWY